jgi:hypothetical protein
VILYLWERKTLAQKFDILIFSLFGRNHWLASQLRSSGLSVALMDLTPLFQKGLAEDWEGPFPLIFPDAVARSYSQSLTDQDRSELLNRGPSLRVRGLGLFEFKSDHASYILNRWGQQGLWNSEDEGPSQQKASEVDFQSTWLMSFLKQWRSSTLKSLRDVDTQIPEFPLNANYILRQPSRRGYMESSAWLTDTGVEVLNASQWWRLQPNKDGGWELTINEENETIQAKKLILGLTSYELQKFSGQMNIPGFNLITPAAFWVRWRGKTANLAGLDFIPSYSMFLSDPEFGIYSENMITLIKRSNNDLDVWACLSNEALTNYEFQSSIQKSISDKLKSFVPELEDLELEDLRMGSDLFSFWPLYKSKTLPVTPLAAQKLNLVFDSPESWSALDNYSRYTLQVQLIESLKKELLPATTIGV